MQKLELGNIHFFNRNGIIYEQGGYLRLNERDVICKMPTEGIPEGVKFDISPKNERVLIANGRSVRWLKAGKMVGRMWVDLHRGWPQVGFSDSNIYHVQNGKLFMNNNLTPIIGFSDDLWINVGPRGLVGRKRIGNTWTWFCWFEGCPVSKPLTELNEQHFGNLEGIQVDWWGPKFIVTFAHYGSTHLHMGCIETAYTFAKAKGSVGPYERIYGKCFDEGYTIFSSYDGGIGLFTMKNGRILEKRFTRLGRNFEYMRAYGGGVILAYDNDAEELFTIDKNEIS